MGGNDGSLVYNHGSMLSGAGVIRASVQRLQQQLADVEASFRPIEQTWTGEALNAYLERRKKWRDAATEIHRILGDVGDALEKSSHNMHATDKKAATFFMR